MRTVQAKPHDTATQDLLVPEPGPSHNVQFYESEVFLATAVADFVAAGLTIGQPVIIIATEPHRRAFSARLSDEGFDVAKAGERGQLVMVDAAETLSSFTQNGSPDPIQFTSVIEAMIQRTMQGSDHRVLRLYGEMVDVLWKGGDTDGAIRLEDLWNELGTRHTFSLLCAYSMGNFYKSSDAERFQEICRQHTHVVPTERYSAVDDEARLVEISRLQQRAHALEAEVVHRAELEARLRATLSAGRRTEETLRRTEAELREALAGREVLLQREQAARAEAERADQAKSDFLAAMSHELRTPLNAIGGYVQLVELGVHGPITEAQRDALARAQKSQQHLLALINDVLNFAKIEAGRVDYEVRNVSLAQEIREIALMVEPQLTSKKLAFSLSVDPDITVRVDVDKLHQILLNLLSNAVKFTPPCGTVCLDVGRREDAEPGMVFLRVSDTGCGIPRAKHESVFDPFVQVHRKLTRTTEGTGLGLAISRDLALGMGGDLRVRSTEGEGSVFTLSLPLVTLEQDQPTG